MAKLTVKQNNRLAALTNEIVVAQSRGWRHTLDELEAERNFLRSILDRKTKQVNYRDQHDAHVALWNRQIVTRVNLLSGKEYQEARGTPGFCSPSSEAYWSM